jgi:chemotaxis protein MotB
MAPAGKKGAPVKAVHGGHGHDDHDGHGGHGGGHDDHGGGGHCPPPWILTFADMATLLMAFFVIMLMTSKPDTPKFMAFAASMRQTFGRVPLDDTGSQMGGTSVLDLNFGPQSGQQTNEPPATDPQSGDPDVEQNGLTDGRMGMPGGGGIDPAEAAAEALAEAMQKAVADGKVSVESEAGTVVIRMPEGSSADEAAQVAEALAGAMGAAGAEVGTDTDGPGGGRAGAAGNVAGGTADDGGAQGPGGTQGIAGSQGASPGEGVGEGGLTGAQSPGDGGPGGFPGLRADMAAMKMGTLLGSEIADGQVQVEARDGKVYVTVGSGGAFTSGSADLSAQAREVLRKVELSAENARTIVVTGHTDNVPLSGSTYRDNWELASARAASVVRELQDSGIVPQARLVATSMGETAPVADNTTEEGRARNRRIEIELQFE